ncbi:MAG: hypothetical protein Q9219_000407 [cf. Caloplaca sp. 3 TL-2023]
MDGPRAIFYHDMSTCFERSTRGNIGGDGQFNGGIFVVKRKKTGQRYVEKKFTPEDITTGHAYIEMSILKDLDHSNIVRFQAGFVDLETQAQGGFPRASMYLEYCAHGNLYDYVNKQRRHFDEEWVWDAMGQLVNAISYLQYGSPDACRRPSTRPSSWIGVIHRDIKLDNIFLTRPPGASMLRLCLGDFGHATREDDDGSTGRMDRGGNTGTMAPEVLQYGPAYYTFAADVFSLGCCISSLCQPPVDPQQKQYAGRHYSSTLNSAIASLMRTDPANRAPIDRFAAKLMRWRNMALSQAGREFAY